MAITDLDEQLLVRAHQAGDEHAFGQIVRSQHRALYAHAYKRLGSHEAAEDAVQDTLLRAYRALPSFSGDLRLRAWLHRILTNVCHDEGNRRRRQVGLIDRLEAEPVELAPDPVEEAVLHDTVQVMNRALAELPESYREALVLRYVDGLSFRDVAGVIGTTEENARARVHRGRAALHRVLSRVSLMAAFLVPGLRRTHTVPADATAAADPGVGLVTQLTTHAVTHAPAISRVAEVATATTGTKSSMVAAAVATVAAVAAPVAAYKVYDTTQTPQPRPAAVAPAGSDPEPITTTTTIVVAAPAGGPAGADTTTTAPATTSTLPRSAALPFAFGPSAAGGEEATTTTTAPPTPTTAPPPAVAATVEGTLRGDAIEVQGTRPDFEVAGRAVLDGTGEPVAGTLAGRVKVADAVGGDATTELWLTTEDGRELRVRFRGTVAGEASEGGATTWTLSGGYVVEGGADAGVAERGTATVELRWADGGPSSLAFALEGQHPAG